jgi:hypothetical protein
MTIFGNVNVQTENVNGAVDQASALSVTVKENASSVVASLCASCAKEPTRAESARIAICRGGMAWRVELKRERAAS